MRRCIFSAIRFCFSALPNALRFSHAVIDRRGYRADSTHQKRSDLARRAAVDCNHPYDTPYVGVEGTPRGVPEQASVGRRVMSSCR